MYSKEDADKALANLKQDYKNAYECIEEAKKDIIESEKEAQNLIISKKSVSIIGFGLSIFLGLGMLFGIGSVVALIIFASLTTLSFAGTFISRAYYNKLIKINDNYLQEAKHTVETVGEINSEFVIPRIDSLQDVVHLNKPMTKQDEDTIAQWKDKSAYQDVKDNPNKEDDINLFTK